MNKITTASSLLSLAICSGLVTAEEAPLNQTARQIDIASLKLATPSFEEWRSAQKRAKYADVTDQFVVTFSDQQMMQEMVQTFSSGPIANQSSILTPATQMLRSLQQKIGQDVVNIQSLSPGKAAFRIATAHDMKAMKQMAKSLEQQAGVAFAEPDPRRFLMAESQPWGISATQSDLVSDNEAGNTTVCIIDSGYDINNPDLSGNMVSGTNDPGTGNWSTPGGSHGTHVAGTIAAINNTQGVVGVLPNQNVNLHIIKVFNAQGWAYSSSLVSAIGDCANAGADVVNMSLGGPSSSVSERNSMQNYYDSGILLVAAAGNDGNGSFSYPASYDAVVAVAAVDENNQHAEFSQYTSQVEIAGPGEAILSTVGVGDGRQGFISVGLTDIGDDRVVPQTRFVQSGSSYVVSDVNGSVSGDIASCSRSGSSYSCGNMNGKICVAERYANQQGSSYPEIGPAEACANAGASGVVVYSNSERPGLQMPFLVDASGAVSVPTVSVNRATGQQLLGLQGSSATLTVQANTDYAYYNGTSMATPHVAGIAALAWSKNPTCTATEVRTALQATALDLDVAGRDIRTGFGMAQAKAASDYMAINCGSGSGGGGTGQALQNGVTETSLAAAQGTEIDFVMEVPSGATDLSFVMTGGSGDADLYVKFGSEPTTSSYDCRPFRTGNEESCDFATPSAGTYYVKLIAYSSFSNVSLTGSYTEPGSGGSGGQGGSATVSDISASRNQWNYYTLDMPAGMSTLNVAITGGTGDADLYVRFGSQPTTSSYDCRPYESGNEETCNFTNPATGTWHIGIRAYQSYSGVTLNVDYQP